MRQSGPKQVRSDREVALTFEVRPSDSKLIECVWRSTSANDLEQLSSVASAHWNLVACQHLGRTEVSVHGPESRAVTAPVPPDTTWVGIRFRLGVSLSGLPIGKFIDGGLDLDTDLQSFQWKGTAWPLPTYDNAEGLVEQLVRDGQLVCDPLIHDVLRGSRTDLSVRTMLRRFVAATGLRPVAVRQIERARHAAIRLREGAKPTDVAHQLGYSDQPHLTHSLRRLIGRTPAILAEPSRRDQLSLLYKTDSESLRTVTFDNLGPAGRRRDAKDRSCDDDHPEREAG